jgi:hypothetical protein
MWKYIVIEDEILPVNSSEEIGMAQEALNHYGRESAPIWSLPASPDDGGTFEDAVKTHSRLFR